MRQVKIEYKRFKVVICDQAVEPGSDFHTYIKSTVQLDVVF